ncbi:MAG TPA: response regulator transcription factor [Longimicrobiaceae bacterium]|nr:response regulator transcription factor [Longimicrobiaceae bacterium]
MTRVLIVEDNRNLAFGLRRSLEVEGYEVELAPDGPAALEAVRGHAPDLVVLDLMLPRLDGMRVLRTLRAEGCEVPVLILTARSQEADKVQGFRIGADDYVVKPVGVLELLARIEAILRRTRRAAAPAGEGGEEGDVYAFGGVRVDGRRRTVERDGEPVELSPLEFELLLHLLRKQGAVVSRTALLKEVWGYKWPAATRTIDTHVAKLRNKLEADPAAPRHLLTVRKVGYRLAAE